MIVRNSTDLPLHEPPTTPITSRRDVEVDAVMHCLAAETVDEAAHSDDGLFRHVRTHLIEGQAAAGAATEIASLVRLGLRPFSNLWRSAADSVSFSSSSLAPFSSTSRRFSSSA